MPEELRFRLLVDSVRDYAIYMLDPKGIVSSWNAGAQRFKGYAAAEIIGQHYSRFYTDEDRQAGLPQQNLAIAATEGRFETEGWRVRKDGGRFWASVVIDAIRDERGRLLGFGKVTRDITDRKAAQEALRLSEERFRLLVQGVTDYAIFMLDPGGHVTNWNSGAQRMKGYSAEDIVGQHFSRFYTEEDRAAGVPARALQTAEREGRIEMEGWRLRKDGSRFWASVVIDAIRDDRGTLIGFGKVTRDITERREAQIALDEARQALFQAQKMEAVGQLTGGIAHDFNNLLQAIGGSLELLERRLAAGRTDVGKYVAATRSSVERAAALTQRLLAFSRRQPLKPEAVDLNALVTGMRDLIDRSVGEAVEVALELGGGLWTARADANQLENALLNLAINARDAMPDGGRLTIATANVHVAPGDGNAELKAGDHVMLAVSDTGVGMPPDVLSRAFEPFFTTKPIGQGTGLGLSQLYGFVHQSDGHIRIDSEEGRGTTVTIWLPRGSGTAAERPEPCAVAPLPTAARGTVLVVEDEAIVRMLLVEALAEQGFTVLEAEDGNAAAAILASAKDIDLLATDVGLPGLNGRQLAEMARAQRPELKVLFLTGYAYNASIDGASVDKAMLGPNTELLGKPIRIDAFLAKVQAMLAPGC
ncbi:hybrid sensor histidine kinase/response regulator [Azospirillum rugosum]|uniref:histidine kinase n=1 Tax=Azospirillum rugosum TaxID=416170 RepID=A0ABS4SFX9_9PROT|nr:PAS domain-containing sensor histidine kinase [Azospirillum rugosum]MBP2290993.1 PAS domain S-box-containing protein [Azospirillum rugosum]MDQ0524943.1 PAS domain S-box-containing protein [Azospirillum rugosum]